MPSILNDDLVVTMIRPASDDHVIRMSVHGDTVAAVGGQYAPRFLLSDDGLAFRAGRGPFAMPGGSLSGVMLREDDLWVCGHRGFLGRSTDRGRTWQRVDAGTAVHLWALAEDDAGNVWVSGDDGYLAVSTDGLTFRPVDAACTGKVTGSPLGILVPGDGRLSVCAVESSARGRASHRIRRLEVAPGAEFNHATVTPAGTLLVIGEGGAVYRSADGGARFERVRVPTELMLTAVDCFSDGRVVVVGAQGLILVSRDDGRSFTRLDQYVSADTFWHCARYGEAMLVCGSEGFVLRLAAPGTAKPASTAPPPEVRDGVYVTPQLRAMLYPRRGGIATAVRPVPAVEEAWAALRRALWAADLAWMEHRGKRSGIWELAASHDADRRRLGERILDPGPRTGTLAQDAALVSLTLQQYSTFVAFYRERIHERLADFLVASAGLAEAARRCLVGLDDELPYVDVGPFGRLRELLATAGDAAYAEARTVILQTCESEAEHASGHDRRRADLRWATTFMLPLGPQSGEEERRAHDRALKYVGDFGNSPVHACGLAAGDLATLERYRKAGGKVGHEFFAPFPRVYLASLLEAAGSGAAPVLARMKPADPFDDDPFYNGVWCRLLAHLDHDDALEALYRQREAGGRSLTWGTAGLVLAARIDRDRVLRLAERKRDARLAALVERECALSPEPPAAPYDQEDPAVDLVTEPAGYTPPPARHPRILRADAVCHPIGPEAVWREEEAEHAQSQGVHEEAVTWDGVPLTRCDEEQLDAFVAHREKWAIPTTVPDLVLAPRRLHDRLMALGFGDDDRWSLRALPLVLHRHGVSHLPVLLAALEHPQSPETALEAAQPFGDVSIVPAVSRAFAGRKHKVLARSWILRHPRHAAAGALALRAGGQEGGEASRVLRYLDAQGHRPVILEFAGAMGVAEEIVRLLEEDPLAAPKAKRPVLPAFAAARGLPPLVAADGSAVPSGEVTELLVRLAFSNADEVHPGVLAARARYTPASRAALVWALLQAWLADGAPPKAAWCMQAVGFLGDDECARKLTALARRWPGEGAGARAQAALDALRNIGTDAALVHLDLLAEKSRFPAFKAAAKERIHAVAYARGLSADELADRLVPSLGLDEDGADVLDTGSRSFRVVFDHTLMPVLREETGAVLAELPRPGRTDDKALAKAAKAKLTALRKDARSSASLHLARMERAMCAGRRIPAGVFTDRFARHPWMTHLARRLVWGAFDGGELRATFRVAEDSTLADAGDELFTLPERSSVGILHPLEFPGGALPAWSEIFADYEILQPFPQLGRATYTPDEEERGGDPIARLHGRKVPYPALRGLESRGWVRWYDASVQMAKPIGPRVRAVLYTDPGWHASDTVDSVEPQTVRGIGLRGAGTFGELSPVAFSELVYDLHTLPGE
ncbi:DUF4132 domain-containing protein [Planobispora takensis]|uniref:DUF4132 domain-containing protein n=1 Tax=Planobispora takensis TaxID=1367882 RepID=A0A8J3WRR6_9ACTN|nr:DUF4132 domain-containing protein [Planobispora takensis]GIH98417.1 hypothetical protein Pta02_04260 [Planobispora takensis]